MLCFSLGELDLNISKMNNLIGVLTKKTNLFIQTTQKLLFIVLLSIAFNAIGKLDSSIFKNL